MTSLCITLDANQAARRSRNARQRWSGRRVPSTQISVGFVDAQHKPGPGLYCWPADSQQMICPLFAIELDRPRDFAPERRPDRNEDGHLWHPDMEGIGDEEFDMGTQLRAIGWASTTVSFEDDASHEMQERYSDSNSPDCSYWTPSRPEGDGWLLAAIYDTEDGPVALYVRRAAQ